MTQEGETWKLDKIKGDMTQIEDNESTDKSNPTSDNAISSSLMRKRKLSMKPQKEERKRKITYKRDFAKKKKEN